MNYVSEEQCFDFVIVHVNWSKRKRMDVFCHKLLPLVLFCYGYSVTPNLNPILYPASVTAANLPNITMKLKRKYYFDD